ncbi:hypothetical protein FQZ97_1093070 [compost metagenome]
MKGLSGNALCRFGYPLGRGACVGKMGGKRGRGLSTLTGTFLRAKVFLYGCEKRSVLAKKFFFLSSRMEY